jgi:hypothetical protein
MLTHIVPCYNIYTMASFRTHISFGIALGVLGIIALISFAITRDVGLMITVFTAAALGSVLPDMDSDSGIPFHITFGSLSIVAGALVLYSLLHTHPGDWKTIIIGTSITVFLVWAVIGNLFARFTRHRGMAHSVPAGLLAALVTFFAAAHLSYSDNDAFIVALTVFMGFLSHLILDEVYAGLNFHGTLFIPNKAFGSALKFASQSTVVNVLVYSAIIFLAAGNTQRLINLAKTFWEQVS